jgi:hypothetical protein
VTVKRTAALVIRAWLEDAPEPDALRARIMPADGASGATALDRVAASEEEILAAVREWLRSFTRSAGDGRVTLDG